MKRIIFNNGNGMSIIVPSPSTSLTLDEIIHKDVPEGADYEVVEHTEIPSDRTFRNAWVKTGHQVTVDMPKAREIHREHLRRERAPKLQQLDLEFMKALEEGKPTAPIVAKKQALRDVTDDPAITTAQTPEELKAVKPEALK